jgi:hypothetical protein
MFDNPEQYMRLLEASPEIQWMESLCESTNDLLGIVMNKLQVTQPATFHLKFFLLRSLQSFSCRLLQKLANFSMARMV